MHTFSFFTFSTTLCVLFSICSISAESSHLSYSTFKTKPKLVITLVIDQMKADTLSQYQNFFISKNSTSQSEGFNFFLKKGAYFPHAVYDVLQSMTGPGHQMISSGSYPYQNGIVLNYWFNKEKNKIISCVDSSETEGEELSPLNSFTTNLSDEFKNTHQTSHSVSIALKDRSAILLGGFRSDLTLWFDFKNFQWRSSEFFTRLNPLPVWLTQVNQEIAHQRNNVREYSQNLVLNKNDHGLYTFDAKMGTRESLATPLGVELTFQLAQKAIEKLQLGTHSATDFLWISLSSHDALGHQKGFHSPEMEAMLLQEDRMLGNFLSFLKKNFPRLDQDAVLVLTADHGSPPDPLELTKARVPSGYLNLTAMREKVEIILNQKWKPSNKSSWILLDSDLNLYLNSKKILEEKLDPSGVELEIKKILQNEPGVAHIFTRSEYLSHRLPPSSLERKILKSYSLARSGDVVLIPKPYYMEAGTPISHQTGYAYDRTVPLIFVGKNFNPGVYSSHADIVDIVPTLAFLLNKTPPPFAEGRVLSEAFK